MLTRRTFILGVIGAGLVTHHKPGHNRGKPTPTPTPSPDVGLYSDTYAEVF